MPQVIAAQNNAVPTRACLRQQGFTLVELMVTIVVAAVLIAVATPSFEGVFNSNRLVGQSNQLVGALQIARSEAVRHNARAIVCRSIDLATCANGANWTGWVAGLDANRDGVIDQVLKVGTIGAPVQVLASPNITASQVIFHPDGFAYGADGITLLVASLAVCIPTDKPKQNVRAVTIAAGSRMAIKPLLGAGVCVAQADAP